MHRALLAVTLVACSPPFRPAEPPPQQATEVGFEIDLPPPVLVVGGAPSDPEATARLQRDQPPHIKLRLGHYRSATRGLGVVIDRTSGPAGAFPRARIKFDGTAEVLELDGQPGPAHRIDYLDHQLRLVLQIWEGGHHAVWIHGGGKADGPIEIERDGDADPLR